MVGIIKIKKRKAFTLVELLVVVAIIGILASLIILNLMKAKSASRDARRAGDISMIKKAVEAYFVENTKYPPTPTGCTNKFSSPELDYWASGSCLTDTYIVGVTNYIAVLPKDPGPALLSGGKNQRGYMYYADNNSAGSSYYKILVSLPESCKDKKYQNIVDPKRDGGTVPEKVERGLNCWGWSYYSDDAGGSY